MHVPIRTKKKLQQTISINWSPTIIDYFHNFIKQFINLSEEEKQILKESNDFWTLNYFKKKQFIGSKSNEIMYCIILKGAVKISVDRNECCQVQSLLIAGDFWIRRKEDAKKGIGEQIINCVEDTILLSIEHSDLLYLISKFDFLSIMKAGMEKKEICFLQKRITDLQILTAYERYEELCKNSAEIIYRFNVGDIANYLGMKSETLSRIRNPMLMKVS